MLAPTPDQSPNHGDGGKLARCLTGTEGGGGKGKGKITFLNLEKCFSNCVY